LGRWIPAAWTLDIEFLGGARGSWAAIRGRGFVVSDWLGRGEHGATRIVGVPALGLGGCLGRRSDERRESGSRFQLCTR
jgi:hypothetical protein